MAQGILATFGTFEERENNVQRRLPLKAAHACDR
jgi:hypothetical protein